MKSITIRMWKGTGPGKSGAQEKRQEKTPRWDPRVLKTRSWSSSDLTRSWRRRCFRICPASLPFSFLPFSIPLTDISALPYICNNNPSDSPYSLFPIYFTLLSPASFLSLILIAFSVLMSSLSCKSIPEQVQLLDKSQAFKIHGRDKGGRKIFQIIGKYFPGMLHQNPLPPLSLSL